MPILPPHTKPISKQDCLDTWRSRGRIPVPTKSGRILDMAIHRIYETSTVDGLPLDLLVEARATHRAPLKRFGVMFSADLQEDGYPIPVLWMREGVGSWTGKLGGS